MDTPYAEAKMTNIFRYLVYLPTPFAVLMIAAIWTAKGISTPALFVFIGVVVLFASIQTLVFYGLSRNANAGDET